VLPLPQVEGLSWVDKDSTLPPASQPPHETASQPTNPGDSRIVMTANEICVNRPDSLRAQLTDVIRQRADVFRITWEQFATCFDWFAHLRCSATVNDVVCVATANSKIGRFRNNRFTSRDSLADYDVVVGEPAGCDFAVGVNRRRVANYIVTPPSGSRHLCCLSGAVARGHGLFFAITSFLMPAHCSALARSRNGPTDTNESSPDWER